MKEELKELLADFENKYELLIREEEAYEVYKNKKKLVNFGRDRYNAKYPGKNALDDAKNASNKAMNELKRILYDSNYNNVNAVLDKKRLEEVNDSNRVAVDDNSDYDPTQRGGKLVDSNKYTTRDYPNLIPGDVSAYNTLIKYCKDPNLNSGCNFTYENGVIKLKY